VAISVLWRKIATRLRNRRLIRVTLKVNPLGHNSQ
jgi:hypothetical protein